MKFEFFMITCSMRKLFMQVCVSFQCEQTIIQFTVLWLFRVFLWHTYVLCFFAPPRYNMASSVNTRFCCQNSNQELSRSA